MELHAHVPLLIASCAPCDGADGLATGHGSAGITVAESASAVATIAADFIRRFFPYYLRRHDFGERRHRGLARAAYSITSSARASNVDGTSRPSALAVSRLITSSYLVGACTGKPAGFSPLRMRST